MSEEKEEYINMHTLTPEEIINRLEENEVEVYKLEPDKFKLVDKDDKKAPKNAKFKHRLRPDIDLADKHCFFEDELGMPISSEYIHADRHGIWWTFDEPPSKPIVMNVMYVILYNGCEEALIGTAEAWCGGDRPTRAVYSASKIMEIFMNRDGMDYTEALEMLTVNTDGGYLGRYTPIVVYDF